MAVVHFKVSLCYEHEAATAAVAAATKELSKTMRPNWSGPVAREIRRRQLDDSININNNERREH